MTQTRASARRRWPKMTYEEYLCAPDIPEHTEWVNGEVVEMMSVSKAHAEVHGFLLQRLWAFLAGEKLARVYFDPFHMRVSPDANGRAPDIIVVLNQHRSRVGDKFVDGPADIVVEIVSPGTEAVDRGDKFYEYERGGVPEYWIIDPVRQLAEFYVRDSHGFFRSANVPPEGDFDSTVLPGFRLHVEDLWDLDDDSVDPPSKS